MNETFYYRYLLHILLLNLGPDWQYGDQDGGAGNIGSVFQVAENGIVHV